MKLNIGSNIRTLRRQADMTQEQLAELLGVTYQSVSRWENGENYPDLELIPQIGKIFDVSADTLLATTESVEEQFDAHMDALQEAADRQDIPAICGILREITACAREYSKQPLNRFYLPLVRSGLIRDPALLPSLRKMTHTFLQHDPLWREALIIHLAEIEDEEPFEELLQKYAVEETLTADALRLQRYRDQAFFQKGRNRDKLITLSQWQLYDRLCRMDDYSWFADCGAYPGWTPDLDRHMVHFCLQTLHAFCGVTPPPEYPVSGDGKPDIFIANRVSLGIRLAAVRFHDGDVPGAYAALEDTVSLLEQIAEMGEVLTWQEIRIRQQEGKPVYPDAPRLTCTAPVMAGFGMEVHRQWVHITTRDGTSCLEVYTILTHPETGHQQPGFLPSGNSLCNHYLTGTFPGLYASFTAHRTEERYIALLNRFSACSLTRPVTEADKIL